MTRMRKGITNALKIDICTTRSISNDINDFINVPKATDARINGMRGSLPLMIGTIRWRLEDNSGQTHTVILPGSYYVKDSPACLLSPQHWAQVSDQLDGVWPTGRGMVHDGTREHHPALERRSERMNRS